MKPRGRTILWPLPRPRFVYFWVRLGGVPMVFLLVPLSGLRLLLRVAARTPRWGQDRRFALLETLFSAEELRRMPPFVLVEAKVKSPIPKGVEVRLGLW